MIGFGQQTYVPDDFFEAWIETTYPAADNGVVNDNYVLTLGIEFNTFNSISIGLNGFPASSGPIFDLTGVEDFKCNNLTIDGTFITSLDFSTLDLNQYNLSPPKIEIRNNQYLEKLILPNNTDTIDLIVNSNHILDDIVFQSDLSYNTVVIANSIGLCELVVKGKFVGDVWSAFRYTGGNLVQVDFSGITYAPYQTGITLSNAGGYSSLKQINFNNNVPIYNWKLMLSGTGYDSIYYPNFSCIEVNSQSSAIFCAGNNDWPSFVNYSTNCYLPINCQAVTSVIQQQHSENKILIKNIDLLGRETQGTKNEVLFYIYNDGTVEKKITIE